MDNLTVGILTVSDTCAQGTATDTSGPLIQQLVVEQFKPSLIKYEIVPDELEVIKDRLLDYCDGLKLNLIFTTGGTGFSKRDVTPEATRLVIEKESPQLTLAMSLVSLEKTKFAVLSRAVTGIRGDSLIINFPGSRKAVAECFGAISDVLTHAVQLIRNDLNDVRSVHRCVQDAVQLPIVPAIPKTKHICSHKTAAADDPSDRNSKYPMIPVAKALEIILSSLPKQELNLSRTSPLDLPPFRASIKDGYAVKSAGGKGRKIVVNYVPAGDGIFDHDFQPNECIKINTGAPVPKYADAIVQIEDTKLIASSKNAADDVVESEIEVLIEPFENLDIRPIGNDLQKGDKLFGSSGNSYPGTVVWSSLLASVGQVEKHLELKIGIISTGDELIEPVTELKSGQIYDSNTTMLRELLYQFGFRNVQTAIAKDSFDSLASCMAPMLADCDAVICTGGVSMGDKDFVKSVVEHLGLRIHFGRVDMKPGKPMTFASAPTGKCVFGLPGNPVSAFVTFHLFVLPALRHQLHYDVHKLSLPVVTVELLNDSIELDARPEYVRATVLSKNDRLYAMVTGNQMSSRLQSIDGADVLLHLPASRPTQTHITKGTVLKASTLKHDFISKYE